MVASPNGASWESTSSTAALASTRRTPAPQVPVCDDDDDAVDEEELRAPAENQRIWDDAENTSQPDRAIFGKSSQIKQHQARSNKAHVYALT
ncbi:hypothetical protein FB451DRAFT_1404031 [Mycena latifolia]|nr:hypothetical protein FB451DRAFT_1404031 [Mycena latifolia]